MTQRFEQILADGIAQCSYLVGDDATGTAAVIDPRPDVDVYFDLARRYGLQITHVLETHIHADFMSGTRELVDRLAGAARPYLSHEGDAQYDFDHEPLHAGDSFRFGAIRLETVATPGHTPEHVSFLLHEDDSDDPWGVVTGDSFFVDSVGRPDLLGEEQTEELVEALFHTIRDFYADLDDAVIIYPCHAAGSACGPDIGDRMSSSIGYERRHNPYMSIDTLEEFKDTMASNAPPVPTHYPRMKKLNAAGPAILGNMPLIPALAPDRFKDAIAKGGRQLLDTRDMMAFGGGHIEGAINIGARPELSVWAGWLLDPEDPLYLVVPDESVLDEVLAMLWRVGITDFGGYLAGGMSGWRERGFAFETLPQISVHELHDETGGDIVPLDVRKPGEWAGGHIPGARHMFLGELTDRMGELDRGQTYATYCGSGFRSSIAASILAANGFSLVRNVPGSWKAWKSAGFSVEKPDMKEAA